jgi:ribosome-dependent ATPase
VKTCLGAFTKGLTFTDLMPFILAIAASVPVLFMASVAVLRKQEA